jgi:DNA-binding transcriptional LysR family regulator
MLFCPPGSELARRRGSVRWKDVANHPLITLTQTSGIRLRVEVGYESAQIPLKPAFEVAQITTVFALAEAGLGIAVLPSYARLAIPQSKLVARPLIEPVLSRDIVVIRNSGRAPEPAVLAFQDVLRRQMRKLATGVSAAVERASQNRKSR